MKKPILLLLGILSFFAISCGTNITGKDQELYNAWELEYITGPRITFQGLFPDMKPKIQFTAGSNMITGNSGCNGYTTKFTLKGKMITFADPELSTLMYCGDGEAVFRNTMKQIDRYRVTDGKLEFLTGDVVMMRFKSAL